MKVRIYLDDFNTKGQRRLKFVISLPGYRFPIKTTVYIDQDKWDVSKQKHKIKKVDELIQSHRKYLESLESEAFKERIPLSKDYIKSKYQEILGKKEEAPVKARSFFDYFDYLKEKYKHTQGYGTIKNYTQVQKQLQEFNPNLTFDDITESFYDEYTDYLISEAKNRNTGEAGLSMNTIGKHWDKIRKVCYEARKEGVQINPCFEDFKSPSYRVDPVWLTREEVGKLIEVELDSYNQIVRDEFLARYYTSLRTSDMDRCNKNTFVEIRGQLYLKFTQVKTKKLLTIPLNQKAIDLFEKYNFQFPPIPQQIKNRHIKEIAQKAEINTIVQRTYYRGSKRIEQSFPKWKLISTHTARRSYGRRFMESGGDINQLREIMGHTDTKTTALYIGWEDHELSKSVNRINF